MVEAPPGGLEDIVPPRLFAAVPESGSVAVGQVQTFRLLFTEKMHRTGAESWLQFYPAQRIRRTRWHGAREAEVELFEPLPADTVVVVEIASGLQDAHRVKSRESRRFPLATAAALPEGRIAGALVMGDSALTRGVVELFAIPPDTVEYFQQPMLRRTVTDHTGRYVFDWLPIPGGPWLARAFVDTDNNLRLGDREARRLLPDTLSLTPAEPAIEAGALTLYAMGTPGRLRVAPFARHGYTANFFAWGAAVAEGDTGWVPVAAAKTARKPGALVPEQETTLDDVPSGSVRVIVFVDVDGDSTFSGVPRESLNAVPDTARAAWYLEPWWMVQGVQVPPGLESTLTLPAVPPTLTAWAPPDTSAVTPGDAVPKKEPR